MSPVVLRGGKPVEIEPMSPGGKVDFGPPIGSQETIHTLHSELRTFGDSFGCREASFRLSLPEALLGFGGSVVSTAAPAAAAIRLLARGRLTARGALPPERCIDPDHLFPELEKRGCEFDIEVSSVEPSELPPFAAKQKAEFMS
jgi:hypothetical protein